MKVVFVVTSFWAYGELLIAKKFADKLGNHHEVMFLIPPTHKKSIIGKYRYMTLIPNSRSINRIIINEISQKYKPDLVILSDFLNYAYANRHYGLLREDLDLFNCKIATFDNFDWKLKRRCMDTYGFVSDIPHKVNIDNYGSRIIPCPLGNLLIYRDDEYRFSLIDIAAKNFNQKLKVKEKYIANGTIGDNPIVLISYAKWQENYVKTKKIDRFIEVSNHLFDKLILELAKKYTIISVGERRSVFENISGIIMCESVPEDIFNEYIIISDLYIGKNITSTSMINIVMSGTPCINFVNSFNKIPNKKEISEILGEDVTDMINEYRYMMFPIGWYEFLKPLFENNPYGDLIKFCELFDFKNAIETCETILANSQHKDVYYKKIQFYRGELEKLSKPYKIVEDIVCGR